MKSGYSANFKNCVTCAYWTGARSLNSTRTRAEYDSGVTGNCVEGGSIIRYRNKSPSASCSNWEKWGQLKSLSNSSSSSKSTSRGKGGIPYPFLIAGVLLVAIIKFVAENWMYAVSIGTIVIICTIVCFLIYRKTEKPKIKMFLTIIVGIVLIVGVFSIIPNVKKAEMQARQEYSEEMKQMINNITVSGGYKPCFGTGNIFTDVNKIVIFGAIERNSISDVFNVGFADNQIEYANNLTTTKRLSLDTTSARTYFTKNDINLNNAFIFPYYGIIFLSKKDNVYLLDSVIPLDRNNFNGLVKNVSSASSIQYSNDELNSVIPILDTWILENADK